jgi:hypothetical protein
MWPPLRMPRCAPPLLLLRCVLLAALFGAPFFNSSSFRISKPLSVPRKAEDKVRKSGRLSH